MIVNMSFSVGEFMGGSVITEPFLPSVFNLCEGDRYHEPEVSKPTCGKRSTKSILSYRYTKLILRTAAQRELR